MYIYKYTLLNILFLLLTLVYFPHILLFNFMCIHLQILKYILYIINCNVVQHTHTYIGIYIFPVLCYYISSIYTYRV